MWRWRWITSELTRADFTLRHRLRVRWAEVDMQRVVFNPQYLAYFDLAVTEYWRAIAAADPALHDHYMALYSVRAAVEFHASAHYDEEIEVCCRVAHMGRTALTFAFGIWRGDEQLTSGEIVYVHADPETQRPAPLPESLRAAISAYERVQPDPATTRGSP